MNVVFDLGGVLFTWKPKALIERFFSLPAEQTLVFDKIQTHADWLELDRGTLGYKEAAQRGAERTGLSKDRIEAFLQGVPSALQPVPETVSLLKRVKTAGHNVYLLSNMHESSMHALEQYDFMELFDGKLYSCQHYQVKPDRIIYETLLNQFHLRAQETIFIDDTPENLVEPTTLGIGTILFNSAEQCERELILLLSSGK